MPDDVRKFTIENAELIYRNFSGEVSQYNKNGDRNFGVILTTEMAKDLSEDGWLVKWRSSREEEEPDQPWIPVTVKYKIRPPRITMITSTARTPLSEETVGILDWSDILTCDLICRAYDWQVGDKTGTKAYLQTMFVTVDEDELELKYAIPPEG